MTVSSFFKKNRKVIDLLACTALAYAPALYYRGEFRYLARSQAIRMCLEIARPFLGSNFYLNLFYIQATVLLNAINPTSINLHHVLSIEYNTTKGLGFNTDENLLFEQLTSVSQLLSSIALIKVLIGQIAVPKAIMTIISGSNKNSKTAECDKEMLKDPTTLSFSKDLPCFYNQVGAVAFFSTIHILNNVDMLLLGRTLGSYCTDKYFASTAVTIAKLPVAAVIACYVTDALGFSEPRKQINKLSEYLFGKAKQGGNTSPAIS